MISSKIMAKMSIITIFILSLITNNCFALKYEISKEVCNSSDFHGITIGEPKSDFEGKSEILLVTMNTIRYYPDPLGYVERYWSSHPLRKHWTSNIVAFKRIAAEDKNDCKPDMKYEDFFLIHFDSNKKSHSYDIYNPLAKDLWFCSNSTHKCTEDLKDHYLFKNIGLDFSQKFDYAFAWNEFLVVIQGNRYSSVKVNQKDCNSIGDLSQTVVANAPNTNEALKGFSGFLFQNAIHVFFTGDDNNVKYLYKQLTAPTIDQNGVIHTEGGGSGEDMLKNFFDCKKLESLNLTTSADIIPNNPEDYYPPDGPDDIPGPGDGMTSTSSSENGDKPQPDENPNNPPDGQPDSPITTRKSSGFAMILIIILIIAIIIALIVCIICCCLSKSRSKSKGEDQERGRIRDTKTVIPASPPKKVEEKKEVQKPVNEIRQRKEETNLAKGPTSGDFIPVQPKDKKDLGKTSTPVPMSASVPEKKSSEKIPPENLVPPDEQKPTDPFEGIDDSLK